VSLAQGLQVVVALVGVCGLAAIVLRLLTPRLRRAQAAAKMRVIERLQLEPRRALYLVEVEGQRVLVGCTESGMTLLQNAAPRVEREPTLFGAEPPIAEATPFADTARMPLITPTRARDSQ
jgi:flagellar protein FliO/FliZ